MAERRSYTVSEVASLVGVKPRAVQYWVEAGILHPDAATAAGGRGVRRAFQPSEVRVAGVAAALGPFGMSTPLLKTICYHARHFVAPESVSDGSDVTRDEADAMSARQMIMVVVPEPDDVMCLFLEPGHIITMENWPEHYGRCIVLVDLKTVLAGLP